MSCHLKVVRFHSGHHDKVKVTTFAAGFKKYCHLFGCVAHTQQF